MSSATLGSSLSSFFPPIHFLRSPFLPFSPSSLPSFLLYRKMIIIPSFQTARNSQGRSSATREAEERLGGYSEQTGNRRGSRKTTKSSEARVVYLATHRDSEVIGACTRGREIACGVESLLKRTKRAKGKSKDLVTRLFLSALIWASRHGIARAEGISAAHAQVYNLVARSVADRVSINLATSFHSVKVTL